MSVQKISNRYNESALWVLRTRHDECLHPYHLQHVQAHQPDDNDLQTQFCSGCLYIADVFIACCSVMNHNSIRMELTIHKVSLVTH
jgi:hypothetical protein